MNGGKMGEKKAEIDEDDVRRRIVAEEHFTLPGSDVSICGLRLENGFSVSGMSMGLSARNERLAYEDAFRQVCKLESYLLAEKRFQERKQAKKEAA